MLSFYPLLAGMTMHQGLCVSMTRYPYPYFSTVLRTRMWYTGGMELKTSDLEFVTLTRGFNYTALKIRHIPTGMTVEAAGEGYLRMRERLLKELEEKVLKSEPS